MKKKPTQKQKKSSPRPKAAPPALTYIDKKYDLVVVGGGIGGTIAAITASRRGLKTALVDNKAGLGGNASSEIGVSIDGSTFFGFFANMREGGPVEELKEMIAAVDPYFRNTQNSGILLFWCEKEKVDVYSELNVHGVQTDKRRVVSVTGSQSGTERNYRFTAAQFVDATGDGTVAFLAGCGFMQGREAKKTFNEVLAPDKADQGIMGASLLYRASEKSHPTVFRRPEWAYEYKTPDDLPFRLTMGKGPQPMGHWWIEYAGDKNDPIGEYETIRKELLKCVYGVWSYFKNDPERNMANYALDTVSITPAKRESRRIIGDYILTERDITERRHFDDAVAYAGWNIDIHVPGGFKSRFKPNIHAFFPWVFTIPLRTLYAKDMDNLWLVGRDMSVSHVALGATRLQGTIGTTGHAAGIAAAIAFTKTLSARETAKTYYKTVQQEILKDGSFIPGVTSDDAADHARTASVTATSSIPLTFERADDWIPVGKGRSLSFPVTAGSVDTIVMPLRNTGTAKTDVTLFFSQCNHPNHFTHHTPLAQQTVSLAPGVHDVSFTVNAKNLHPGLYAVLVMTDGTVEWLRSRIEPYGAYTGYYDPERYFTPSKDTKENLYAVQKTIMVTPDAKPVEWHRIFRHRVYHYGRSLDRGNPALPFVEITPRQNPYAPANITSGVSHTDALPDLWISDPSQPLPQDITLSWEKPKRISSVRIVFDTDLDMPHPAIEPIDYMVKSYTLSVLSDNKWKTIVTVEDNRNRFKSHDFAPVKADAVKLTVTSVHAGGTSARVFEIRCY
ncbi:MAG: FAD-dependent oxidoreductase [Spirochaetes bacterium]|nr:FAD-dependent oxidoreductase [Spirochaetota bacterium]